MNAIATFFVRRTLAILIATLAITLHCGAIAVSAQQRSDTPVSLQATGEVYVGSQGTLRLTIRSASGAQAPEIKAPPGLSITHARTTNRTSGRTVIVNGQVQSQADSGYQHDYAIIASKADEYIIPSQDITVDGRVYRTAPVTIVVREPAPAKDSSLTIKLDRSEVFVGEPVRVTFQWTFTQSARNPHISFPITGAPEAFEIAPGHDPRPSNMSPFDNRFPVLEIDGQAEVTSVTQGQVGGKITNTLTVERIIIPRAPGEITIGPARIDIDTVIGQRQPRAFDSPFDDLSVTERQFVQAPPITLRVNALPTAGRPSDFSGLVGNYSIEASADAKDAAIGDPINLAVTVKGPYPLSLVPPLDLNRQPNLRGKFRLPRDPILANLGPTAAKFDGMIRPRNADITQIGPIELNYFDPDSKTYKVAATKPLPLVVRAGTQVGIADAPEDDPAAPGSTQRNQSPLPNGLAGISREPLPLGESSFDLRERLRQPAIIALLATPPLICAALTLVLGIRRRYDRDPALRRRLRAARTFRSAVRGLNASQHTPAGLDVLARALANFASDLSGEHADALTAQQAAAIFADTRAASASGAKLADLVRAIDIERFGIRESAETAIAPLPADPVSESLRLVRVFVREHRSGRSA